jgi:hypothetical protein
MQKFIPVLVLSLSGCASLQEAGSARYEVKPFTDELTGNQVCCSVTVHNGKEIASLDAQITRGADGAVTVHLIENGVAAFQGQAIAAGAAQDAINAAAKAAVATALAPILPTLVPAAGAALASPGLGAAAVGAGGVLGAQQLMAPASGQGLKAPAP